MSKLSTNLDDNLTKGKGEKNATKKFNMGADHYHLPAGIKPRDRGGV